MNLLSIESAVLLGLSIVGFFLKDLFSRFGKLEVKVENNISKYNTEFGKLIGRLNTIDTRATGELKRLEEMMDIHFKNQSDKLEELQRMIERMNTNR
jgi:hypothetical protein